MLVHRDVDALASAISVVLPTDKYTLSILWSTSLPRGEVLSPRYDTKHFRALLFHRYKIKKQQQQQHMQKPLKFTPGKPQCNGGRMEEKHKHH